MHTVTKTSPGNPAPKRTVMHVDLPRGAGWGRGVRGPRSGCRRKKTNEPPSLTSTPNPESMCARQRCDPTPRHWMGAGGQTSRSVAGRQQKARKNPFPGPATIHLIELTEVLFTCGPPPRRWMGAEVSGPRHMLCTLLQAVCMNNQMPTGRISVCSWKQKGIARHWVSQN